MSQATIRDLIASLPVVVVAGENRVNAGRPLCLRPLLGESILSHSLMLARDLVGGPTTVTCAPQPIDEDDVHIARSALARYEDFDGSVDVRISSSPAEIAHDVSSTSDRVVVWSAEVVPRDLRWALPDARVASDEAAVVTLTDAQGSTIAVIGPPAPAVRAFHGDQVEDTQLVRCNDLVVLHWWPDVLDAEERLRQAVLTRLLSEDVCIERPDLVTVGLQSRIDPGATLLGSVSISGASRIGSDAVIEGPSNLRDSQVGKRVHIRSSELDGVVVTDNSSVGPYAVLRPGTVIGQDTRIGSFVEISAARIGDTTDIRHLAYVGDAVVGDRVNVGAGVVVAQFDGVRRYQSRICDGAFIGANSTILGGATVGRRSYVGAGAEVTADVEDGALYLRRAQSSSRSGWVDERERTEVAGQAAETAAGG